MHSQNAGNSFSEIDSDRQISKIGKYQQILKFRLFQNDPTIKTKLRIINIYGIRLREKSIYTLFILFIYIQVKCKFYQLQ